MEAVNQFEDAEKTDDGLTLDKEQNFREPDSNPFSAEQTPILVKEEPSAEPREDDLGSSEESPLIKKLRRITEMNQENE